MSAGVDLRDLYRPGGGTSQLTLRRLLVLIRGLEPDSLTHLLIGQDREQAESHDKVTQLRDRTAHYRRQAEQQQKVG
jgi:hypothetical protein